MQQESEGDFKGLTLEITLISQKLLMKSKYYISYLKKVIYVYVFGVHNAV